MVLNSGNSWTQTYNNIPSGVKCTVTDGAGRLGAQVDQPAGEFTIVAGQTVTVNSATSDLSGGVVINKVLEGDVAGASTEFTLYPGL